MANTLSPQLFETIAGEAMFGIVVFDLDGNTLYTNKLADDMLATRPATLSDLQPATEHPQLKSFTSDLLRHDGLYQDIMIRKGNGSFIANLGVRTLTNTGTLLMLQDVTLQKKLQREITSKQNEIKAAFEELLQQNRKLTELDHAKDRFIALTTHELRTPLSAMVASAEILKLGLYDGEDQLKEFVDMIYDQGLHLQELVNDILDFAKIQAGKMDFFITHSDPTTMAKSIFKNFEGMASANRVSLHVKGDGAPLLCYFDELRLRQVLSNIISNSIKYNRPDGRVELEFSDLGAAVKISVRDTGKGIPREQFAKVFNEFETIGEVAHHHKGTGLGMPISRKLTEGMGGKLELESEVGVGSVFWVELPKMKTLSEELYRPRPDGEIKVA